MPGVGTNRYAYAGNDPVNLSDPGGNAFWDWFMSQGDSDEANYSNAEDHQKFHDRMVNETGFSGFISRATGSINREQSYVFSYLDRVGVSRGDRIKRDLANFFQMAFQMALMGVRPTVGAAVRPGVGITNSVPVRLARVMDAEYASTKTLGSPIANDVFVTAADDLAGVTTGNSAARALTLVDETGTILLGPRAVISFDTPSSGLASPVFRTNPGFVGGGQTAGGAREFVLPNLALDKLLNVTVGFLP